MTRTAALLAAFLILNTAPAVASIEETAHFSMVIDSWSLDVENEASLQEQEELYQEGTEAIDDGEWREAVRLFGKVAQGDGSRADGALYWKAYAQQKLGQRAEALETLAQLLKRFPSSRWSNDAKALELEIRQASGQTVSPERVADEELKLIALNSLMGTDPERAASAIEKVLKGSSSPKLKEKALFVLAQSDGGRARALLTDIALGRSNPDLQARAIKYLGINPTEKNKALLLEAYRNGTPEVKKAVLKAFMIAGDRARLLDAARSEKDSELRAEAVQQLGVLGSRTELAELYRTETSRDVKKNIIRAMFVGGSADKLSELALGEKDPELRAAAIKNLGLLGANKTGPFLVNLYQNDPRPEIRKAVIQALFVQSNAKALIALARGETDRDLKKEIVRKLSLINTQEALDYMQEVLNN